jgi:hypothetical protein
MEQQTETHEEGLLRTGNDVRALYGMLAEVGVQEAVIEWQGSGDEGSIHTVTYTRTEGDATIAVDVPHHLDQTVVDVWDAYLYFLVGNYWDNEGGVGEACMDIPRRETRVTHGWYVETVEPMMEDKVVL